MIDLNDNYTHFAENEYLTVGVISVIGDREEQQDRVGYEISKDECAVVLCDGMGGHNGGKSASNLAIENFLKHYKIFNREISVQNFLLNTLAALDKDVAELKNSDNEPLQAGTTLASIVVIGSSLNWASVGDSRIYAYRNGEIVQITKDHNYGMILESKKEQMPDAEYSEEVKKSGILVSFLGINGLPFIESNDEPFQLFSDDIILITSDGLYKILSEKEIGKVLRKNNDIRDLPEDILLAIKTKNTVKKVERDNISVAIIKIK